MSKKRCNVFANQRGFTLIEVLIAAIIAAIALTAGFEVLINHNKSHLIQAGVSDMQQNNRAAIDELVGNIRKAGYRLPAVLPALSSWNTNPDTIAMVFMSEPACTAELTISMTLPSSELKCTGYDLSCFDDDIWAYIYEPASDSGEFFYITHVDVGGERIQHSSAPLTRLYQSGSEIVRLRALKYYVDISDTLQPKLMVKPFGGSANIFADGIEDIQFRYLLADGSVRDTITASQYVREVLVKVMARSGKTDLFLEDYRKDTLSTRVRVRNL